jgi:hypothetical protein
VLGINGRSVCTVLFVINERSVHTILFVFNERSVYTVLFVINERSGGGGGFPLCEKQVSVHSSGADPGFCVRGGRKSARGLGTA